MLLPGQVVYYRSRSATRGIVVANTGVKLMVLWSNAPSEVNYSGIAQQVFKAQPMPSPSANVFYHNYSFSSGFERPRRVMQAVTQL